MFGLSKREQRWKAEQKAVETLVPLLVAAIATVAAVRIAEINKTNAKELTKDLD